MLFIYLPRLGLAILQTCPSVKLAASWRGAFAPLAFLWLVIGHFMQQSEISANTQALQAQEQSIKRQELQSRRDGFFKLLELVQGQLGSIAGFHFISVVGSTGTGEVSDEQYSEMRSQSANGDSALFCPPDDISSNDSPRRSRENEGDFSRHRHSAAS